MPVGMFSPDANTDTVNPLGTTMFWAWSGAKSAVSAGQSGFLTTGGAASETAGGRIGVGEVQPLGGLGDHFGFEMVGQHLHDLLLKLLGCDRSIADAHQAAVAAHDGFAAALEVNVRCARFNGLSE